MPIMQKLRDLLTRGFFPRELPPVFVTGSLGDVAKRWASAPQDFLTSKKTPKLCFPSNPRSGSFRRQLALPNPVTYATLCREFDESWRELQKRFSSPILSKSTPTFHKI